MRQEGFADLEGQPYPNLIPSKPELKKVIESFSQNGFGAWIVGGAVRDSLLGKKPIEFDLCTNATPTEMKNIFENTIPTGEKYGTITIKSGEEFFEATTLRTEMDYGDGRRPEIVEWGGSLAVDLSRRDFTINSMAYDLENEVLYDPYNGVTDLKNGVLRAVGDAHERLAEDGLRILRAYRFMDRGDRGVWIPDFSLSSALIDNRSMISLISVERIWSEFTRIILGQNASIVLKRMNDDGVLFSILQEPIDIEIAKKISTISLDLEARLALLMSDISNQKVKHILTRLKVSNFTLNRCSLLHSIIGISPKVEDTRVYRKVISGDVNAHFELNHALGFETSGIEKALEYQAEITPLIDGNWLMERTNLQPGEKLGKLKDWLFRIQIERGYTEIEQMEAALCSIPWNIGDGNEWPKVEWP